MPVTLAGAEQEDLKFKAILGYRASLWPDKNSGDISEEGRIRKKERERER